MKILRFFTIFKEKEAPILYKLISSEVGVDITLLTIAPVIENFTKEYTEDDIMTIAEPSSQTPGSGNPKKLGYFRNEVFHEDINLRELDFTSIEQLVYYIQNNNLPLIKWYLEAEIDLNQTDEHGNYPLMYVKDFYVLKMLIVHNAKINLIHKHNIENIEQPVYYYIIANFDFALYIVKYLLKQGLDARLTDSNGEHFLYRTNEYEIHRLFAKHGLEIDAKMITHYYDQAKLFRNLEKFLVLR